MPLLLGHAMRRSIFCHVLSWHLQTYRPLLEINIVIIEEKQHKIEAHIWLDDVTKWT